MHHQNMHRRAVHHDLGMQQAPLFEAVVRNVLVLVVQHGPARQHGVAMFAVARDRIGAVNCLVALGRQEVGLRQLGPAREVLGFAPIELAHLLQADDVRVELLDRVSQVVNLEPAARPDTLHPLVDVVSGNPQYVHGMRSTASG